jgi:hypothetical protein
MSEDPAACEARELAEDIATAKKVAPFFCMFLKLFTAPASDIFISQLNPMVKPTCMLMKAWSSILGPGFSKEYLDAHPNIHAHSEACAPPGTDQICKDGID